MKRSPSTTLRRPLPMLPALLLSAICTIVSCLLIAWAIKAALNVS